MNVYVINKNGKPLMPLNLQRQESYYEIAEPKLSIVVHLRFNFFGIVKRTYKKLLLVLTKEVILLVLVVLAMGKY